MPTPLPLKVLLLEDRATDSEIIVDALRQANFNPVWQRVETKATYLEALNTEPDIILSDYSLPQFEAPDALILLQERDLDIPFIVVTGTVTEESVVECMKQGAADYLLKDRLARLGQAVTRAIHEKHLRMEKHQAQAALHENEKRIQRLTEQALDVIFRYRLVPTSALEYINPAVTALTGYTPAECYATPGLLSSLIYEEDEPLLQELIDSSGDLAKTVTLRWVHRDGSILWTEQRNVLIRDDAGHIVAIEGIVRDITERKQTSQALQESEARFHTLFEQSPLGISIARAGIRFYTNPAFAHLFGYDDPSELVGVSILNQAAPQSRSEITLWLTENPEYLSVLNTESLGLRKDGSVFPCAITVGSINLPDGKAIVTFASDLTTHKRLEEETRNAEHLRIELEKEKELNQLKERFTSMVSHEFRTPLTVILTSSELVEQYFDRLPAEKRLHYLRETQNQVKIMITLLDDVLDFSKAQAGKIEFSPQPLNIETFCTELFEPLQTGNTGIHQFIFVNQSQHSLANLDAHLMRHILVNLLSNAIKYSPAGGEIRLELSSEENQLIFRVSDQGLGIPSDDLPRLFEPFHRAKNIGKIRGTGLGMSIVKSNVEAHGGTISVESHEGHGTIFTVRLPMSDHPQQVDA